MKLEFLGDGKFKLLEPLKYKQGIVNQGFVTDGFTLPWFVRWFHNPFGKGLKAAIVHDYELAKNRNPNAHIIFRDLLIECGVNKAKAQVMYLAVTVYQKLFFPL